MCTSVVSNRNKTIVGWNLDIVDMEYAVVPEFDKVYIAINDQTEGWLPLFGANARGDFVAMPTCWPFDDRSDPTPTSQRNLISLDIDLLFGKRTLAETLQLVEREAVSSVPGVTFQAQLSDQQGDVLRIVPGQGHQFLKRPRCAVMTNFSPLTDQAGKHPWMGLDRYATAVSMLDAAADDFDVDDCFEILKRTAQKVCPTVVSMVFDVAENKVCWCEDQSWNDRHEKRITSGDA
ncbi:MAG: hypothetical protein LBV06_09220 [Propionibacteriaceae bacterium]|jgi:hypothetical protein|nr:hypothetical protein [Propionibacteriaceae bacterium]